MECKLCIYSSKGECPQDLKHCPLNNQKVLNTLIQIGYEPCIICGIWAEKESLINNKCEDCLTKGDKNV